jgi:hypothetical protein
MTKNIPWNPVSDLYDDPVDKRRKREVKEEVEDKDRKRKSKSKKRKSRKIPRLSSKLMGLEQNGNKYVADLYKGGRIGE